MLGRFGASLVYGVLEEVCQAERARQNDEDEHEREETKEPTVGQRGGVGRHGMLEELADRAVADFDDLGPVWLEARIPSYPKDELQHCSISETLARDRDSAFITYARS